MIGYLVGAEGCRSLPESGCCGRDSAWQEPHPKQTSPSQTHLSETTYSYTRLLHDTLSSRTPNDVFNTHLISAFIFQPHSVHKLAHTSAHTHGYDS